MSMNIKDEIKKYQRKYFKGVELDDKPTYVYVKKVIDFVPRENGKIYTYSNVLYFDGNEINFGQNKKWYFGKHFIKQYGYKEIKKSEYMAQLKKYGFSVIENSEEYSISSKFIG